jgi:hypothetical protein
MGPIEDFNLFDFYNASKDQVLISYKGPIDGYVIRSFGDYIKRATQSCKDLQDKLFKTYMELIQNVAYYSKEQIAYEDGHRAGIGTFVLLSNNGQYILHIGNVVSMVGIRDLTEKCDMINQLDRDGLREFKRVQRAKPFSSKGGGNIGLIEVALASDGPLNYNLTPMKGELAFFDICVKFSCL